MLVAVVSFLVDVAFNARLCILVRRNPHSIICMAAPIGRRIAAAVRDCIERWSVCFSFCVYI